MKRSLGLLGAGSQALEAADYDPDVQIIFRAVSYFDSDNPSEQMHVDIRTSSSHLLSCPVIAAVGAPGLRRSLIAAWSGTAYGRITSPQSWISPEARIGLGTIIAPGAVITALVQIGQHVIVNVGASISHSSTVGDYCTISPGVRVAGDCLIGDGCFFGIGAILSNGISIVGGTVLGAGAVVTKDITIPGVYVGVPARRVKVLDSWIDTL